MRQLSFYYALAVTVAGMATSAAHADGIAVRDHDGALSMLQHDVPVSKEWQK